MKVQTPSGGIPDSFRMQQLSAVEIYNLAMDLTQICNDIFTLLHEQCEEESSRGVIDRFIVQTRSELHSLNKMWLYELSCEYFSFNQPGELLLHAENLHERLHAAGGFLDTNVEKTYENMILYHQLCQIARSPLDLRNSRAVYAFCINLRRDLFMLLLSMSGLYHHVSGHKVLDEVIDQVYSGNRVLGQLNWQ